MADNDTADVVISNPWKNPADGRDYKVGDKASLDPLTAKSLIRAGYAVPATKPAAQALGVDPDTAKTAKK